MITFDWDKNKNHENVNLTKFDHKIGMWQISQHYMDIMNFFLNVKSGLVIEKVFYPPFNAILVTEVPFKKCSPKISF